MVGLELVLQDFGEISRKAFELRDKEKASRGDAMESLAYFMSLHYLRFYDDDRIVWWDGREGFMPENPIGNPEDYLGIRDDYEALKSFIASTVDKGKVHAGGGTHGDTSRETNCADYISWLHQNNQNQDFKRNVERATTELLAEAFDSDFTPYSFEEALRKATEDFETGYNKGDITKLFIDQDIGTTRWRYGIDHPNTPEEREFREWYDIELTPTIKTNQERWNEETTHFAETSLEFQEAFKQRYLGRNAEKSAVRDFSPQFNRLIGLLDVASSIGEHDEIFVELYGLLREKAEARFMADSPPIAHHYSSTDIYRSTLVALASAQQGTELQKFWLDKVRTDSSSDRVIVSVHGALTMHNSPEERRQLIPSVLENIQQRGYDMDKGYQRRTGIGFYTEENLLDDLLSHITNLCFDRRTFSHLDQENATIDFLQDREVRQGEYTFRFNRYTTQGTQELEATFDITEDRVEGDGQLENSVRAYIQQGYELPSDVWVTSLEGRKISGTDSKIVDASGQQLDGQYEGVVGLNHTHFGFIYNPTSQKVTLSEPLDSSCTMFGGRSGWEESRMGLDKVENQVPYSQFQAVAQAGERVNQLVAERRKSALGDSLFGLDKKLTDDIAPYLTTVIQGRIIQNSDGLVQ
jgi:hypothetical protein